MLRNDYNNTEYTVPQIDRAVKQILAANKSDYKLEGYNVDSVKLLCRNGYDWTGIVEIMWDNVDEQHLDILIEYRSTSNAASASAIQIENAKKHLPIISGLLMKYMDSEKSFIPVAQKKGRSVAYIVLLLLVVIATIIAVIALGIVKV